MSIRFLYHLFTLCNQLLAQQDATVLHARDAIVDNFSLAWSKHG